MAPTGERGRGQGTAAPTPKVNPKKGRGKRRGVKPRTLYKFSAEAAAEIVEKIGWGNYLETAAAAAGVSKPTLFSWLKKGKALGRGPIWKFAQDVKKAKAKAESDALQNINKAAGAGIWQSAAWLLERRHPKRWGRREVLEHVGKDGGPIQSVDRGPSVLTSEQRIRRMQELEAKATGQEAALATVPDGSEPPNGG